MTLSESIISGKTRVPKLYEWLDMWLELYQRDVNRPATIDYYWYAIKRIKRYLEDVELTELNELTVRAFVKKLTKDGLSRSTIKSCLLVLRQALDIAVENNYISVNPTAKVKAPKTAPRKKVHALTVQEERLVIEACKKIDRGDLFIFLLNTGLRREEVCELKWCDYHEDEQMIFIPKSKTAAGERFVPLNKTAIEIINRQPRINDWIFNNAQSHQHNEKTISRLYRHIQDETGIMFFTTHVCRHTFATRLIECGVDPGSVSKLLGHESVSFTLNTYVTIDKMQLKRSIQALDARNLLVAQ